MNCACCFEDYLCKCLSETSSILINTQVNPYKEYFYRITDKFDQVYTGQATVRPDGALLIPVADLPDGLLTQWSGSFIIEIFSDKEFCEAVPILLARQYSCIELSVKGGNLTKSAIGCSMSDQLTTIL